MELAAAHALAQVVEPDHLEADYVIPSVFDRRVAPALADAVARAAEASRVARRIGAAAAG
jgi:malate dehydrogenase (oxaloacetate-decarboxylating)